MELYMQIERLRLKNKFSYDIKVEGDIDVSNTMIPPLLLQPFIENSIWHGMARKEVEGHIDIEIKRQGGMMVCAIDDNGIGRKKILNSKGNTGSMGIKITKNRLEVINQLKKVKGNIELFDKAQGLRVELKLPLELRF